MRFFAEIGYAFFSVLKGLAVTGRNLLRKKTTMMYPEEPPILSDRYRGFPIVNLHTCIGCLACEKICPNQLIHIERSPGEVKGRWKVDRFDLDYSLCMMCNLCEDVCPTSPIPEERAIVLHGGYELAGTDRVKLTTTMEEGKMTVAPIAYYREQQRWGRPTEFEPPPPAPEKPAKPKREAGEAAPKASEGGEKDEQEDAKKAPALTDEEKAARIAAAKERAARLKSERAAQVKGVDSSAAPVDSPPAGNGRYR